MVLQICIPGVFPSQNAVRKGSNRWNDKNLPEHLSAESEVVTLLASAAFTDGEKFLPARSPIGRGDFKADFNLMRDQRLGQAIVRSPC